MQFMIFKSISGNRQSDKQIGKKTKMNFVGPSIIVLKLSSNYFHLLFPQLQDLLLKKFNFVHEQSNCVRLRSYETFEAVIALCSSYFYPQHLTSIPNQNWQAHFQLQSSCKLPKQSNYLPLICIFNYNWHFTKPNV